MEFKCYRNINKKIIVPYLKIGLSDFLYLVVVVFSGFAMFYIFGLFSMALALAFLMIFLIAIVILFFWLRRQYYKDGTLDVLVEYFDFILSNSTIKGRNR